MDDICNNIEVIKNIKYCFWWYDCWYVSILYHAKQSASHAGENFSKKSN